MEEEPEDIVIQARAAQIKSETYPASVIIRVYYSSYHLWAARHFAQLAKQIEDEHQGSPTFNVEHRAYVTSCIFSSVAFMEAAINEVFGDANDKHMSYIDNLGAQATKSMAAFWKKSHRKASILYKYMVALDHVGQKRFDKGKRPYQEARLLIDLRNVLVHYKPKSLGSKGKQHKFEGNLKTRFATNQLMAGADNPFFPDKCLGYGCCEWAIRSSEAFTDDFFSRIGVTPNYQRVDIIK